MATKPPRPLVDEDCFDLAKKFLWVDFFDDRGKVFRISEKRRENLHWRLAEIVQRTIESELAAISSELQREKSARVAKTKARA